MAEHERWAAARRSETDASHRAISLVTAACLCHSPGVRTPADYLNTLTERAATGDPVDYLYFWKALPGPGGRPGPGCLSQWWQPRSPWTGWGTRPPSTT